MIPETLPELIRRMACSERSLDIGGWHTQMNSATHVIDHYDYDSRQGRCHDAGKPQRFSRDTWLQFDINRREPWPFPDGYFEFSMCSHVLEDIRDPIWVLSELQRVSRAGYLETPRPCFELLAGQKGLRPGTLGAAHHRWFVEFHPEDSRVAFRLKTHDLLQRGLVVRYWTALYDHRWEKFNQGMFWEDEIRGEELSFEPKDIGDYVRPLLPEARALIFFAPVSRIRGKVARTLTGR